MYFSNPNHCLAYLAKKRWPDGVVICPTCGSKQVHFLATRRLWQCVNEHTRRQFSIKVGTVMEDSAIGLDKWLCAMWMLTNDKNGISSYELHRAIGVTQKSAWFMLHRIRKAMADGSIGKLGGPGGEVEVDEIFIGGKFKNMHSRKRNRIIRKNGGVSAGPSLNKTAVMGILDRDLRKIRATVVANTSRKILQDEVLNNVTHGTSVFTDESRSYVSLRENYVHEVVNHIDTYVRGRVHTNGLENFWSLLKRGLNGTYISVEPFHLSRYVDEQAFRFNNRATKDNPLNDNDRFELAVSQIIGKRLTYKELTGKELLEKPRPEAL
ncbi:MAG TPA: IS1595 family transposase [Candidatus Angelobacter sp.]|nr:IS1595 family transposase [Candidatus Angelobacter sp.]